MSTVVRRLDAGERVDEIARMVGGAKVTPKARAHAEEMLRAARPDRAEQVGSAGNFGGSRHVISPRERRVDPEIKRAASPGERNGSGRGRAACAWRWCSSALIGLNLYIFVLKPKTSVRELLKTTELAKQGASRVDLDRATPSATAATPPVKPKAPVARRRRRAPGGGGGPCRRADRPGAAARRRERARGHDVIAALATVRQGRLEGYADAPLGRRRAAPRRRAGARASRRPGGPSASATAGGSRDHCPVRQPDRRVGRLVGPR